MKLTASNTFNMLARGGSKVLQWKFYIRFVGTLNQALNLSNWTDVSSKVIEEEIEIAHKIEYEHGQFTCDSLLVRARDVAYWRDLIFRDGVTTNPGQYAEFKVEFKLGDGTAFASDTLYMFAGFIDYVGITFDELNDECTFKAFTAEDLAGTIAAERISAQYLHPNIDGFKTTGLVLPNIPGLYVKNAAVAPRPLSVGVHTITYQVNGGLQQAKLDNCTVWKTLVQGDNVLGDVDNSSGDTQRVTMHVFNTVALSTSTAALTDSLIILQANTVLPRQFYQNTSMKFLLRKIYELIGIDTVNFDSMTLNSYDGNAKMSFLEIPPADSANSLPRGAMATNGTDIFVGVGNVVYKRTMATEIYTVVTTVPAGNVIWKLFYNARKNFLWTLYGPPGGGGESGGPDTISMTVRLNNLIGADIYGEAGPVTMYADAYEMIDYNYTGSSYHQSVLYVEPGSSSLREIVWNGTDFAPGLTLFTIGFTGSAFPRHIYRTGATIKFTTTNTADNYQLLTINSVNAWVSGSTETGPATVGRAFAFNSVDSRIYRFMSDGSLNWHSENNATATTISGISVGTNNYWALGYLSDGRAYGYAQNTSDLKWGFFSVTSGVISWLARDPSLQPGIFPQLPHPASTVLIAGRYFGLSNGGTMFMYATILNLYVGLADFSGLSVRDALSSILKAGNLVATNSATKSAFVYRRGDLSGIPQTTGNILTLNISDAGQIEEELSVYQSYGLVVVSSQSLSETYDGQSFGASQLSNVPRIEINNKYIPDLLIRDMTYYFFQFFRYARRMVRVTMPVEPLFQYEVFDAANVNFLSPLKLQRIISGVNTPIYAMRYLYNGSMAIECLVTQEPVGVSSWNPPTQLPRREKKKQPQLMPALMPSRVI